MKRKALIIASPCSGEDFLAGVAKDADNYRSFLTSSLGGGWLNSEITTLSNPSKSQVKNAISDLSSADYSMIIFTGHGESVYDEATLKDVTVVWINDEELFSTKEFKKNCEKRTIILDCCRKIVKPLMESNLFEKSFRDSLEHKNELFYARKYYDECIIDANNAVIVMNACSLNETAREQEYGGDYTYALIASAKKWEKKQRYKEQLSVVSAHNLTIEIVKAESEGTQNPVIGCPRSGPYFPFAIKI